VNARTVADVLLVGDAVAWVLARQVHLARVKPRLLVLAPLILASFGIRSLPASIWRVPADLALLTVSAALWLGLGVWRGQPIKVWRDADGTLWRQGSVLTLVLWGVLIVARGLLYGVGAAVGHRDASDLGAVLVTLALSFAAQNTVTAMRMNAAPRFPPTSRRAASRLSQPPAAPRSSRHGWLARSPPYPPARTHPRPSAGATRTPRNAALGMTPGRIPAERRCVRGRTAQPRARTHSSGGTHLAEMHHCPSG
jgi:hypothetical protein